jgi:hypothetical protein
MASVESLRAALDAASELVEPQAEASA